MRKAIKIVKVILLVLLVSELLAWLAFGIPPLRWHGWYLLAVPLGVFIFWPTKRGK